MAKKILQRSAAGMARRSVLMVGVAAIATGLPVATHAQEAGTEEAKVADEIVVTARREAELLKDIPVSVQVVSGDQVRELSITNSAEISKLAPGLTITNTPNNESVIVRGVRWTPGGGTPATPIYLNEIAFDPSAVLQSLFDVGQVEILRGPQGTARGAPSVSGAITIGTRRPDLGEIGGYVQGSYGEGSRWNLQGAINLPIVQDVLAVRLAGNMERSDYNRVRSVNNSVKPRYQSDTFRATALFTPTDNFELQAMYQRTRQRTRFYIQVDGSGSPGFAALGIAPNFNGPPLTVADARSVQDGPSYNAGNRDFVTVNAHWDILGQRLSYNFGRQFLYNDKYPTTEQDQSNFLPGYAPTQSVNNKSVPKFSINEVRLSSVRQAGRFFDYDIGFYSKQSDGAIVVNTQAFLPGAFGATFITPPGGVTTPVSRYVIPVVSEFSLKQDYKSVYGNVQLHIGDKTELTAGLRRIWDKVPIRLSTTLGTAFVTFPRFLPAESGGCPSPFLPDSPVYGSAYCDVQASSDSTGVDTFNAKHSATIYSASLSHKFSEALMTYATVGSSFRTGLPAIGNSGLPPTLVVPKPEKATSYELGVKATPARGVQLNFDVFQIDYSGQLTQFQGIQYYNSTSAQTSLTSLAFYSNVDSRIRGVEAELTARPIENLDLGLKLSYAKIKSRGGLVPCNSSTPLSPANPMNFCQSQSGQTLNASAPFQATANGSYTLPMGPVDGYLRFNVNYQGDNPNYSASLTETKAFALVDLFAGVTGDDGAWDVGLYAKNVFNKRVVLTRLALSNPYPIFAAPIGYDEVNTTLPRELGLTLRYSFGSR